MPKASHLPLAALAVCLLAATSGTAQAAPSTSATKSFEGSRIHAPKPKTSWGGAEGVARAYVGGKFQRQQALCSSGGRIEVFPPSVYQVNSWYYGDPSRYSEKIWWRPLLYKYSWGKWRLVRSGIWSWGYVNIVGMVPSYYVYGVPQYWRTGSGTTRFVPFSGLTAGSYAVRQQAYWERPQRSKFAWTVFYRLNSTVCRFV